MTFRPTAEQISALQTYAAENGIYWKAALRADWFNGRARGELQQVRNAGGPSWLRGFKLPAKEGAKQGLLQSAALFFA